MRRLLARVPIAGLVPGNDCLNIGFVGADRVRDCRGTATCPRAERAIDCEVLSR